MTEDSKNKIKEFIIQHLNTIGYPDISSERILQELPVLWSKLAQSGLIKESIEKGLTFQTFAQIAQSKAFEAEIMSQFANHFRR